MFPSFIGILDIQSWWEVPSIAYFCSLFRTAFNLLDFDIEELEEALLTDETEECAGSLLTELIVRLLKGCLGNNDISAFNYQMYLRRLFRRKCQETGRYNPFNTDIDFQFLPLRTKVEILYALCDFRLDADDVFDLFKNLEAESLRVEPLGWDDNGSAFWYFYGTRLYREDIIKRPKGKSKKKKSKEEKKHGWLYGDDWLDEEDTERVWQVVCFTEADWTHLTNKFSKGTSKVEKKLYRSLSQNFLPEIPRLFQEKERLQRKRLLELPRRTSSRVLQKIKQKEEESKQSESEQKNSEEERRGKGKVDRENRAKRRSLLKSKRSSSSESNLSSRSKEIPLKKPKCNLEKSSKTSSPSTKGEPPPEPPVKMGRKTNNSLSSATGEILISDDEPVSTTRKKLKTSQIFSQSEEDIKTDMYKVLEQLTAHEDAWPFLDPVEEEYAPNYYAVIRRPMDLRKMEERLDNAYYTDYSMFEADFKLIVNNCRLYNGQDNEYTVMVENLQNAFDRLTEKYIHRLSSSDEEIAVEYPLPTPSRKHKIKSSESPERVQRKKRKSHSETGNPKSNLSDSENENKDVNNSENKESHKTKVRKSKKKRKGRHRHGKHSKSRDKSQHGEGEGCKSSKRAKKSKRLKENKKSKKKRHKENKAESSEKNLEHTNSLESPESSNRSRSASPLPSIHTPTPSPTEPEPIPDPDFYKDKYDKIKERKRTTVKDAWESLINYKQKTVDKQKQNLLLPEKDKNQKLTETIEKLKAKNEKYKDSTIFNSLFTSSNQSTVTNVDNNVEEFSVKGNESDSNNEDFDDSDCQKDKQASELKKKGKKRNHTTKNEITSEALEQAVKDISKLLDDKPKGSTARTPPDSPTPTIFSTEEQDNSRQDDELYEKALLSRKELSRKRPSSREPRIMKRRELQRTIDRLQPGKSKGNLLTNVATTQKVEEQPPIGTLNKVRDVAKAGESSPKLSLGSVLPTVDFTLGNDLNFNKSEETTETQNVTAKDNEAAKNDVVQENNCEDVSEGVVNEPQIIEERVDDQQSTKTGQEKATPNLSAWFKAFGAPKSSAPGKKKTDDSEQEDKPVDPNSTDNKPLSPKTTTKYDSPGDEISPNPEGGDSPLLTQRHRRTSTGSSVSERSSFSQDLDSPRHQIAHTSPLLRSPASPRTDEFQKITYPIINGTVRAGFYQDTTSLKSSPEKSCSPRDAPQSPYSPYSQHVYASNSMGAVNSTMQSPNYFMDHSKTSIPTYGQAQTSPYYESAKPLIVNKPENLQQNQYSNRYSPNHTAYSQEQTPSFVPNQELTHNNVTSTPVAPVKALSESKPHVFPMKKRAYNDLEAMSAAKPMVGNTTIKDDLPLPSNKEEYQKIVQSIHSLTSLPSSTVSVNNLTDEKPEMSKINDSRDKHSVELIDRHLQNLERHTNMAYESNNTMTGKRKEVDELFSKPIVMTKKDTADIMHSGYNNIEIERKKREETTAQNHNTQAEYNTINISKANTGTLPKGYEIDAIAINLGLNHAQSQKGLNKNTVNSDFMDSEHTEKISSDVLNQSFSEFDNLPMSGSSSLNDINIDLNKKLFSAHPTTPVTSDYESWKATSRDSSPADLSTSFSVESNKTRSDSACTNTNLSNYKNYEYPQYENYTMAHSNVTRNQDLPQNMISELRIPNPRTHIKNDTLTSLTNNNLEAKSVDTNPKSQKSSKSSIEHPILSRYPYKGTFIPHGPLEPFLNIPGVFDRFTNDERFYSRFAAPVNRDKSFTMAQMLSKSGSPNAYQNSSCVSIFNHGNHTLTSEKEFSYYKNPQVNQGELMTTKEYNKKKKTSVSKHHQSTNNQSYQPPTSNVDVLSTTKSNMPSGSAFNFGTAQSAMALGSLYADNGGFSIEDFRNSTANQLMTGSYMTAAATSHQRSNKETNPEKFVKPAHQNRPHTSSSFPFMDHTQVQPSYSFVGTDPSSPLYQQYLQRHQEHLLRQTGAQIMSLYPTGYPSNLSVRQPYDSINRPSWL